jgi:hypothetical protein
MREMQLMILVPDAILKSAPFFPIYFKWTRKSNDAVSGTNEQSS